MATETPHRFFTWMRSLGIQREPGWIGGVAAGIATRLGIDPLIVRGIIVVVAILGGPALLVYAAAWLLLPDTDDKIHLEELIKGNLESPIAGIGVLVLLSLLPVTQGFWFAGSAFWGEPFWGAAAGRALWTLVILALAVWLVVWLARRSNMPKDAASAFTWKPATTTPPPPAASKEDFAAWREQQASVKAEAAAFRQQATAERTAAWKQAHEEQMLEIARQRTIRQEERRLTRSNPLFSVLVIGLALVAGGITTLSLKNGELEVTTVVAGLAVALAVLALGMLVNGLRGRRPGGAAGLAAILVLPLFFFTLWPQNDHFQYGSGYFAPSNTAESAGTSDLYLAGFGATHLDLTDYYDKIAKQPGDLTGDEVYLFVGKGNAIIDLPAEYVGVNVSTLRGDVYVRDAEGTDEIVNHSYVDFNQPAEDGEVAFYVYIFVLSGDIYLNEPEART